MKEIQCILIYILLLLFSLVVTCQPKQSIEVCNERCQTLQNVSSLVNYLQSTESTNEEISFASLNLSEILNFKDLSPSLKSILFYGRTSETVIHCIQSESDINGAGFDFYGVHNITFVNITIEKCGVFKTFDVNMRSESYIYNYSSALYFESCTHITLTNLIIRHSTGTALTLLNNKGLIEVTGSYFEGSSLLQKHKEVWSGGNGLYLLLSSVVDSYFIFRNCHFLNNNATAAEQLELTYSLPSIVSIGLGGGLCLSIGEQSHRNEIVVYDCTVEGNGADWGGGIYIQYYGLANNNVVNVSRTNITDNFSYKNSGGGIDIGFVLLPENSTQFVNNFMFFQGCNFINNWANLYGGGAGIFAIHSMSYDQTKNYIQFEECLWENNSALAGSAVDITPAVKQILSAGNYPIPLFINCNFLSNFIRSKVANLGSDVEMSTSGVGAMLITRFSIIFQQETNFTSNTGGALFLSSGRVNIFNGSSIRFYNNSGKKGGAISMTTFSVILINDNSLLSFVDNIATLQGGGLFVESGDPHEYLTPRSCFIQYGGTNRQNNIEQRNIEFEFEGNKALSGNGNDVYASSISPCIAHCEITNFSMSDIFRCIGMIRSVNFTLNTGVVKFVLDETENTDYSIFSSIIPGNRPYHIPISALDNYDQVKDVVYHVVKNEKSALMPQNYFITQNQVRFIGSSGVHELLTLEEGASTLSFNIMSSTTCPPGYKLENQECVCAAENIFGIGFCNRNGAYLINGFWIGICPGSFNKLCSSHCPLGFCIYTDIKQNLHLLPDSIHDLDNFICGSARSGVICGKCNENYSAFYHSYRYSCGLNADLCKYGIVFYILSEIFPLTVMFLLIIIFDVSFTSGYVNGFIFYAQVLDSLSIDANGVINFPFPLQVITDIHRFIYRTLNFDFFSLEPLSFCLWRGATVLDAMVMKYATVLYAIGLLLLVIIVMNTWKCKQLCSCWRPRTIRNAAIHGLIAFIVICYSQCARVSIQILTPTILYGFDYEHVNRVVFRRGEYALFSSRHLVYALPALVVLIVMLFVPFFLLVYPLIFKALSLCNLSESKLANVISRFIPIPLLDSFQSSFKDNCRFFAGLYFLYRLFALATHAYSSTLIVFYSSVQIQLVFILALHAAVHPYKQRWHNVLDSLMFANLAIINGFTLFNYVKVIDSSDNQSQRSITIALTIQAIFIYLPLLYIICYSLREFLNSIKSILIQKIQFLFSSNSFSDSNVTNSLELPPLRDVEMENEIRIARKQLLLSDVTYGI